MGFRQILAVAAVALDQVGDGVEAEPVDSHLEPEVDDLEDGLADGWVVVVKVRLVRVEAVPEISTGERIPGPIRLLEVFENDARVLVLLGRVAPDVEVAF